MRGLSRIIFHGLGLVAGVLAVLLALDAGSVMLTKLSVPDDVRTAGYAATAVTGKAQTATKQTAVAALTAAASDALKHGITVRSEDFTVYPDGRVTLTGVKKAPTLLLGRVHTLSHLARVSTTVTVSALPYSGSPAIRRFR